MGQDVAWEEYKNRTIESLRPFSKKCSDTMSMSVLETLHAKPNATCIAVGGYRVGDLLLVARGACFQKGHTVVIDTWSFYDWRLGYPLSSPEFREWKKWNFKKVFEESVHLMNQYQVGSSVSFRQEAPEKACTSFKDETIDFLYLDGHQSEERLFSLVCSYFPKLKEEGVLLLNVADSYKTMRSLVFLMERMERVSSFSAQEPYLLLKRKKALEAISLNVLK